MAQPVPSFLKPGRSGSYGGGDASTPIGVNGITGEGTPTGPDQMTGAIASQLLGIANDTGTHQTGHAGYTVSKAADRAAATDRFAGYKKDARKAANRAARAVMGRNAGIRTSYRRAGNQAIDRAADLATETAQQQTAQQQAFNTSAAELGLGTAVAPTRTQDVQNDLVGQTNANAQAWAGFDTASGRRAVERNRNTAIGLQQSGRDQAVKLNGILEQVLAGLQDQTVASTLGTAQNVSLSQRLQALTGLRYLNNDQQQFGLDQQKLAASLVPDAPVVTTERTKVNPNGSSVKTTTRR